MQFFRRTLPDTSIAFASEEGKKIFREALNSDYMDGYFRLASQLRTQDEPAFCGLAALVMTLNALGVDPGRVWKGVWRWYQEDMLNCCTPIETIKAHGITLEEFVCLARCNGLKINLTRVDDTADFTIFKNRVKDCCHQEKSILVASYSRKAFGQTGDGHFAPIGGYHQDQELVLLMETARFKYPSHWVRLENLWKAMQRIDGVTGKSRGYLEIDRKDSTSQLCLFNVTNQIGALFAKHDESLGQPNFLGEWQKWLAMQTNSEITLQIAVKGFLEMLSIHPPETFFLTFLTVGDPKNEQQQADRISIVKELHSCVLGQIVNESFSGYAQIKSDGWFRSLQANKSFVGEELDSEIYLELLVVAFLLSFPWQDKPGTPESTIKTLVSKIIDSFSSTTRQEIVQLQILMNSLKCCKPCC